jgi:hypothetical protein
MPRPKGLKNLSLVELEKLVAQKKAQEKAEPLMRKRDKLLKAAAKLEKKIAKLLRKKAGPGRPRGKKRGRPAKKGKVGRPAGKARKISAAGRARIAAAQKKRWAKIRAAKKARQAKPRKAAKKAVPAIVKGTALETQQG